MDKPATPLPWKLDSNQDVEGVAITIGNQGETWNFATASQDAAYIVTACNAYPHLTAINAELVEALDMARDLIQEAKGADGPNGGFITDHLDAAQNWIDNALVALARAKENSNGH